MHACKGTHPRAHMSDDERSERACARHAYLSWSTLVTPLRTSSVRRPPALPNAMSNISRSVQPFRAAHGVWGGGVCVYQRTPDGIHMLPALTRPARGRPRTRTSVEAVADHHCERWVEAIFRNDRLCEYVFAPQTRIHRRARAYVVDSTMRQFMWKIQCRPARTP